MMSDTTASADATFDSAGVDLTLIRWMLSLTPDERLQFLQNAVGSIQELRRGRKGS